MAEDTKYAGVAEAPGAPTIRVYRRRWLILAIFMSYTMTNAAQWIQYAILSNVVQKYYAVSSYAVDWTSIIFMLTYIPLIFPATTFLEKWGLRWSMIAGAVFMALGAWMKVASLERDRFWVVLLGQTVVSLTQVFMLNVPPHLAPVWFPSEQVSTACSLAIFGNQVGIALGFLLPPMVVQNRENLDEIGADLAIMCYVTAAISTVVLLAVLIFFEDHPPLPPSVEVANKEPLDTGLWKAIKRMYANKSFMWLLVAYSVIFSVINAVFTLLNQLILTYFPGGEEFAGRVGLLTVVGGMAGAVACGLILDTTHKFKETTLVVNFLTLFSLIVFTFTLSTSSEAVVYTTAGFLGVFLGGFLPVGFEFASELTYPESENTVAGMMLASAQLLSVVATVAYGWLINVVGDVWANAVLCVVVAASCGLTLVIKSDLRRQEAHVKGLQKH